MIELTKIIFYSFSVAVLGFRIWNGHSGHKAFGSTGQGQNANNDDTFVRSKIEKLVSDCLGKKAVNRENTRRMNPC